MAILVFGGLVAIGLLGRMLPHVPNFTPVAASALFAGMFFRRRLVALAVPLTIMGLSDFFRLGGYDYRLMATVYLSLAFPVLLRSTVRGQWQGVRVLGCASAGAMVFFFTTNFAVWLWSSMYERSFAGLLSCYVAALPFFKYTLAGDLLWSTAFFGAYAFALRVGKSSTASGALPRSA